MSGPADHRRPVRLPPEVNRILYVSTVTLLPHVLQQRAHSRSDSAQWPVFTPDLLWRTPSMNLPFKITADEMYDIFGKYGAIRQIRLGDKSDTRGTAFVVYEDIYDAKAAVDHLSGFNVCGRYLIVLYYQAKISQKNVDEKAKRLEIAEIKAKYNVKDEDEDEVVPPPRKRAAA
eukprot:15634-Heterococcus_DN1.PRE.2